MRRRFVACFLIVTLVLSFFIGAVAQARPAPKALKKPATSSGQPVTDRPTTPPVVPPATPYQVKTVDERWSMRDGVTLPVSVFYPIPRVAGELFPVVVFVHPWDMDRSLYKDTARDYASSGYVGVCYTVRGWFGAEGDIGCIDPEHEMKDLSAIITRVSGDRRWRVRTDAKGPIVGVTGYSMGGVHTYLIAPRQNPRKGDPGDPRVRAVVPQHGGCDLVSSIYPNGCVKWAWANFLLFGVYNGNWVGGLMNAMRTLLDPDLDFLQKVLALFRLFTDFRPNSVTPELLRIYDIAVNRRTEEADYALSYLKVRSARYWCDEEMDGKVEHPTTVPTLIVTGWKDDLFTPNEGLCAFNSLVNAPKHIIITNSGHAGGMGLPFLPADPVKEWTRRQVARWFDHYLKGVDNGIDREPAVTYYRDWQTGELGGATSWPPAGTVDETYYLGARTGFREGDLTTADVKGLDQQQDLLINNGLAGSISLPYFGMTAGDPGAAPFPDRIKLLDLPFTRYSYLSQPLGSDLTLAGAPRLSVSYKCSQPFTQLIPLIYEVKSDGTEVPVTRGWYEGHCEQTGTRESTDAAPLVLTSCCHRFSAGSRIRLDIQTADLSLAWPYWAFSLVSLLHESAAPPRLVLPVANLK
jgi:putative CocE/NonD family hydrolase